MLFGHYSYDICQWGCLSVCGGGCGGVCVGVGVVCVYV